MVDNITNHNNYSDGKHQTLKYNKKDNGRSQY
jgi:hypothetical protein